ncbi:MAG: class I SAM-dependent methyltransferase [Shewanella sp.]
MNDSLVKLNLACGSNYLDGWINIDIDSEVADLILDLTQPLPYADGSVSHIYAEHFIEHIDQSRALSFLRECKRVLANNGVLRISTPSLYFLIINYMKYNISAWGDLWMPPTRAHMVNEGMRSWGHQFLYDSDEITRLAFEAGFNKIRFEEWKSSEHDCLKGIETRNFHDELIVELEFDTTLLGGEKKIEKDKLIQRESMIYQSMSIVKENNRLKQELDSANQILNAMESRPASFFISMLARKLRLIK